MTPLPLDVLVRVRDLDLPVEELVKTGPAALSDEHLAALAAQPGAMELAAELIAESAGDGDLGEFWWRWMRESRTTSPDDRGKDAVTQLVQQRPSPAAMSAPGTGVPRRVASYLPWAVAAASVLFAAGVWLIARQPVGMATVVSVADLQRKGTLGPDDVYELGVTNPRDGFATAVVLTAKPPSAVYPELGRDDVRASPGARGTFDSLSATAGTRILVFVTETPATDVIRRALDRTTLGAGDEAALRQSVVAALRQANHRWVGEA